ncbi:MAG: PsbP-related protein [Eubacteriales bacterium]|nr:PsbP-related protein [Eubacteriales bacterium]
MNEIGAMNWVTFVLVIIFTVLNLVIYHKLFRVVYFNLGAGLLKELIVCFILALVEAGLVITFFASALSIVGKLIITVLKIAAILVAVVVAIGIIAKLVEIIRKNVNADHQGGANYLQAVKSLFARSAGAAKEKAEMMKEKAEVMKEKAGTASMKKPDRNEKTSPSNSDEHPGLICRKCERTFSDLHMKYCIYCGEKLELAEVQKNWDENAERESEELTNVQEEEPEQTEGVEPEKDSDTVEPMSDWVEEVHDRLMENLEQCNKIKKIEIKTKQRPAVKMLGIDGNLYRYILVKAAKTGLPYLSFSWSVLSYLIAVPILMCSSIFVGFFWEGEYFLALTICTLICDFIWIPFAILCYKEANEITTYIGKTIDHPFQISRIKCGIAITVAVIEIILAGIVLVTFGKDYIAEKQYYETSQMSSSGDTTAEKSVSLDEMYVNEAEGLSFRYPAGWTMETPEMEYVDESMLLENITDFSEGRAWVQFHDAGAADSEEARSDIGDLLGSEEDVIRYAQKYSNMEGTNRA